MADYARNKKFFSAATLLMLAVSAYLSLSLVWHAPVPCVWRVPLSCALVLFSLSVTGMRVLVTRRPDLPFAFVRAGGFVSTSFMALTWLTILRDAVLLGVWACSLVLPALAPLKSFLLSGPFELGLLASSFVITAVGMRLSQRVPVVREHRVGLPRLPRELEGLRLVQISDLHIGACFGRTWLEKVVERCRQLEPDFVLITGDMADGTPDRIEDELRPLAGLQAKYGVVAVPGNHDYYSGLMPWLEKWRTWGLELLLNEHRDFDVNGCRLRVAGITDKCAKHFPEFKDSARLGPPDLRRALSTPAADLAAGKSDEAGGAENLPPEPPNSRAFPESVTPAVSPEAGAPPADFTLLLSHRPGDAQKSAAHGVDFQLCGHTHGGQFFFLFPLVEYMNHGWRAGMYSAEGMPLHVSPGTGMWGYAPMRCGSRSEISLLVLTS